MYLHLYLQYISLFCKSFGIFKLKQKAYKLKSAMVKDVANENKRIRGKKRKWIPLVFPFSSYFAFQFILFLSKSQKNKNYLSFYYKKEK